MKLFRLSTILAALLLVPLLFTPTFALAESDVGIETDIKLELPKTCAACHQQFTAHPRKAPVMPVAQPVKVMKLQKIAVQSVLEDPGLNMLSAAKRGKLLDALNNQAPLPAIQWILYPDNFIAYSAPFIYAFQLDNKKLDKRKQLSSATARLEAFVEIEPITRTFSAWCRPNKHLMDVKYMLPMHELVSQTVGEILRDWSPEGE